MRKRIDTRFSDIHTSPPDHRCMVAAAMVGAAVVGAAATSYSANKAAKTQAGAATTAANAQLEATRETNQQQWSMYQQQLANESPYMQGGQQALAALQNGLGLGQLRATGNTAANQQPGQATGGSQQPTYGNAAGQTVDANGNPIVPTADTTQNYGASQDELNAAAGSVQQGQFSQTFKPSDLTTDPSYQWRLQQGLKSLQASAAARGGLLTGQGAADINNYAQGAASQEYQASYDRFMNNQNTLYNRLAGLAGVAQTATNSANSAGQNAANQMGANTMAGVGAANGYMTSAAAANAAGQVATGNAISGSANNAANSWMTWQMMRGNNPWAQTQTPTGGGQLDAGTQPIDPNLG